MHGGGRSALVLAMPHDFFGWHYIYANTAVSVGVHTVVLMRPTDGPIDGWTGGIDNDRVNDRRDESFLVREDIFEDGLEIALARVYKNRKNAKDKVTVDVEYVRGQESLNF